MFGHRIESVRPVTRKADKTAHRTPVDRPLEDVPRQIYYRQNQSALNNTADVQKFGERTQISKRVLKYLFTERV